MSDEPNSALILRRWRQAPWRLWVQQVGILVRREVRRSLLTKRRIWVYLLAFVPVLIMGIHRFRFTYSHQAFDQQTLADETRMLAGIIQLYYVRLGLFFACMGIFTWLFRGEMVERTLHYPFLTPVRREVLVIGKFLAAAAIGMAMFEVAVIGCFFLLYNRLGSLGTVYAFHGPGLHQLGAYLLVVALAVLAYGSVFLGLSLVFRNPIVPGALFFGWETVTPVLPSALQMLSVTYYLKHLYPVRIPSSGSLLLGLFTVPTGSVSAPTAILGLLAFTAAVLAYSCYRIRKMEITYTTD